jgi:hypothetical protein
MEGPVSEEGIPKTVVVETAASGCVALAYPLQPDVLGTMMALPEPLVAIGARSALPKERVC